MSHAEFAEQLQEAYAYEQQSPMARVARTWQQENYGSTECVIVPERPIETAQQLGHTAITAETTSINRAEQLAVQIFNSVAHLAHLRPDSQCHGERNVAKPYMAVQYSAAHRAEPDNTESLRASVQIRGTHGNIMHDLTVYRFQNIWLVTQYRNSQSKLNTRPEKGVAMCRTPDSGRTIPAAKMDSLHLLT